MAFADFFMAIEAKKEKKLLFFDVILGKQIFSITFAASTRRQKITIRRQNKANDKNKQLKKN